MTANNNLAWLIQLSFQTLLSSTQLAYRPVDLIASLVKKFYIHNFKMAGRGESEGFASSTLDQNGARPKDSYFPVSDAGKSPVLLRQNLKG